VDGAAVEHDHVAVSNQPEALTMNRLSLLSQALLHNRRTFLLRSAGTMAFPLALVGCGGGGGDNSAGAGAGAGTKTPIVKLTESHATGTIALPTGATVKVARVENAFGSSVPATDGSFDFVSVAESEMFAVAIGPGGKMVLSGLLQAGSAQLSARSTALCLAYTALGVGAYLPSTQEQYLAAMQASPTLTALESAVAAAIVARGEGWLDLTDPVLKSAVAAMQAALSPTALAGSAGRVARPQAESNPQGASKGSAHLEGMIIDRTDRVSGIQVTGDGVGTITLTNYYRRRSYAYIDRVSYKASYAGAAIDSPATVGVQPLKVDATKSITSALVTLAQLFGGVNDFYDPVVYAGNPTLIAPDGAALTTYRVTSVGLGVSTGDLSQLTATQRDGLRNVCAETFVLDIVVPIFCGILIPIRNAPMTTFIEALAISGLKDLISTLAASDDILLNKIVAANRPLSEVLWDALLTLVNTDTLKNAILGFFQQVIDALSVNGTLPATNVVNVGAQAFLSALSAIDLTVQTMDLVATGLSFAFSDLADRFLIDVTKSQVRLNPRDPQIDATQQTSFTLSVIDSDLVASDLSYQWSCTCLFGRVSDGVHISTGGGASFASSSPNLFYSPTSLAKGGDQDLVTGTIYKGNGNARVPIGTATSTVSYNTVISPAPIQLVINTRQTFTADISTTRLASATALQYVWTLTGAGSIGAAATVTTTMPTIAYQAPATVGTDTLALSVITSTGTVISRGSAVITVLASVAVGIAPQNPQVPRGTLLNFVVNPVGAGFPTGATFKWVLTHALDLFGRAQDLGGSGGGTIGVNVSVPPSSGRSTGTSVTVVTSNPTITLAANPFGPEAFGTGFHWTPALVLAVSVLDTSGGVLATSSTVIQTQMPQGVILP
jgi:hypothetical protein